MSTSKKSQKIKRHSAPSAAAGSPAQITMGMACWTPQQMHYPWQMSQMPGMQGPMFAGTQSTPQQPPTNSKVCESGSESDESDFELKPKKSQPSKGKDAPTKDIKKRGRGRPKKEVEYVATIPAKLNQEKDSYSILQRDECRNCKFYKGVVALKPCGHAFFCRRCINKVRLECVKLKRPAKCLVEDCFCTVKGWLVLRNVNV